MSMYHRIPPHTQASNLQLPRGCPINSIVTDSRDHRSRSGRSYRQASLTHACPRCGSENVRPSHRAEAARGLRRMWGRAYRCRKCGARFRELATTAWAVIGAGALALLAMMTWGLWHPLAPADHADVDVQLERSRVRTGADDYAKAMRYLTGDGVPKDVNHERHCSSARHRTAVFKRSTGSGYCCEMASAWSLTRCAQ